MKIVDLNILVYAYNHNSELHGRAKPWLEQTLSSAEQVALPWIVLLGFLRVMTRPGSFSRPLTVQRALEIVESWLSHGSVAVLAAGENHWSHLAKLLAEAGTAGNLTNDEHLAALAIEHHAELCSTDADFGRFHGLRWTNPLALPRPSRRRR
jgi:uncharacterized protein